MNYRQATILPSKAITAAGTETIDIKDKDPISRLMIKHVITATANTMASHGAKDMTKIELVDGSDVLYSVNGYEAQALAIYDRKCASLAHGQHISGNGEVNLYPIDFGRKLWDPRLALDPTKFKNLQLKISHTLTSCYSAGAAATLEVLADLFDERAVKPEGFLMAKEQYSYTTAADGSFEYIDLPTDYPLRKMLVRGFYDAKEPWNILQTIRLDENNLKKIPLDIDLETYARIMKSIWTPVTESIWGYTLNAGYVFYVTPTEYYDTVAGIAGVTAEPLFIDTWQPGGKLTIKCATSTSFRAMVRGYLPNHCFEFPFGDPDDPADWYDVTKIGSLRLRLESGSYGAGGTGQLVLQQLRKY